MARPICEDDLHAWADDRLDAARRPEVETWLAANPDRAAKVAAWRDANRMLHAAYDSVIDEPVPARLRAAAEGQPRSGAWRAAAVAGWITLGALAGGGAGYRLAQTDTPPPAVAMDRLPRAAALAHAVYVPEVRHPVEVAAADEAHLIGWLTKRLGAPVRIPDLAPHGFALLGGRLLPATDGPGAQFMYEDTAGRRLTLYLSARSDETGTTAFRFAEEQGVAVFYWVDGPFGYALSGSFGRDALLPLANTVYHQLSP